MIENECVEAIKMFGAETFGAGIGAGIILTIIMLLAGKVIIEWILKKWKSTELKLPK